MFEKKSASSWAGPIRQGGKEGGAPGKITIHSTRFERAVSEHRKKKETLRRNENSKSRRKKKNRRPQSLNGGKNLRSFLPFGKKRSRIGEWGDDHTQTKNLGKGKKKKGEPCRNRTSEDTTRIKLGGRAQEKRLEREDDWG